MSVPLTINGVTYNYPQVGDVNWGPTLTAWSTAVTIGLLQKAGGTFTLTNDVNFGASFGLLAAYFKTRLSSPATAGLLRLSASDTIEWRNNASSADNILAVNGSDLLTYNGVPIASSASFPVSVANGGTGDTSLTAYAVLCGGTTSTNPVQSVSGLGLSGQALTSNGAGVLPTWQNVAGSGTVNTGTAGTFAIYPASTNVVGSSGFNFTFAGQLGVNNLIASNSSGGLQLGSSGTNNTIIDTSVTTGPRHVAIPDAGANSNFVLSEGAATINGVKTFSSSPIVPNASTSTQAAAFGQITAVNAGALPLTGGTMSGAIAMGANTITGLANGTASTDAMAFGQFFGPFQAPVQATNTTPFTTSSTAFVNTNLTASITPTSASHRVKITITGNLENSAPPHFLFVTIARNGANLLATTGFATFNPVNGVTDITCPVSATYIDSPSSTSATTYSVQVKTSAGGVITFGSSNTTQIILLEEIA